MSIVYQQNWRLDRSLQYSGKVSNHLIWQISRGWVVLPHIKICSNCSYKMHKCLECQKLFGHAGALKDHMVTHSKERAHACVQCNKSFGKAQHMKSYTHKQILTHSKETPLKCTQCNYACWEAGNLRRHMKTHFLQKSNQCKWCEYSSIIKSDLSRHLLTHSGERSHFFLTCILTWNSKLLP